MDSAVDTPELSCNVGETINPPICRRRSHSELPPFSIEVYDANGLDAGFGHGYELGFPEA